MEDEQWRKYTSDVSLHTVCVKGNFMADIALSQAIHKLGLGSAGTKTF